MRDAKKILLGEKFVQDVQDANEYQVRTNPDAVRAMKDKIEKRIELLRDFPELGKLIDVEHGDEMRLLIFEHHLILYKIRKDTIYIERFLNEKQDYMIYT